jgi:hypothetical protein
MTYPQPPQYGGTAGPYGPTGAQPRPINHTLHLILTILSCGTWGLFVWAPMAIWRRSGRRPLVLVGYFGVLAVLLVIGAVTSPSKTPAKKAADQRKAVTSTAAPNTVATTPATTPAVKAPAVKAPAAPKVLLDEHGNGVKQTATFTVDGSWDLKYSFDCASFGYDGNFIVTLYDPAHTNIPIDVPANAMARQGGDTTHQHRKGSYYLEINSECAWTLQVINTA